ncbi:hypothetical protein [Nocardiopsis sp. LOL_012]|uniref:hypothetical protein n=1 Tax=Nocardiopsis sp. LOL_012 TaxID=3345409 RepID=UPI003A8C78B9
MTEIGHTFSTCGNAFLVTESDNGRSRTPANLSLPPVGFIPPTDQEIALAHVVGVNASDAYAAGAGAQEYATGFIGLGTDFNEPTPLPVEIAEMVGAMTENFSQEIRNQNMENESATPTPSSPTAPVNRPGFHPWFIALTCLALPLAGMVLIIPLLDFPFLRIGELRPLPSCHRHVPFKRHGFPRR